MLSHVTPAICLFIALSPLSANAETAAPQNTTFKTSTVQLHNISQQPLEVYQQALNYLLGRNGVMKSAEKAADLFKTLAEQNWSSAQHMLGNMYLTGKGVEKNDLLAYKWLSLASKNNLQLAEAIQQKRHQLYAKLQNNLSLASLNKVETWITEWKPENSKLQLN